MEKSDEYVGVLAGALRRYILQPVWPPHPLMSWLIWDDRERGWWEHPERTVRFPDDVKEELERLAPRLRERGIGTSYFGYRDFDYGPDVFFAGELAEALS